MTKVVEKRQRQRNFSTTNPLFMHVTAECLFDSLELACGGKNKNINHKLPESAD